MDVKTKKAKLISQKCAHMGPKLGCAFTLVFILSEFYSEVRVTAMQRQMGSCVGKREVSVLPNKN